MHVRLARRTLLILIVLLLTASWSVRRYLRRSAGVDVGLPADSPTLGCSDLVLSISKQHLVKISYAPVPRESPAAELKNIYSQRYKHVLLVRAEPDISFQEVMGVVDIARGAVPDMRLVLLTPRAEKTMACLPIEGLSKMD
jgi:biopolymer transport protein ExbD